MALLPSHRIETAARFIITVTMARMQSSSTRCPQHAAEFGEKSEIAMLYRIE